MREKARQDLKHRRREQGFALVLAMLALMLLTFLGLTLATTTSTELQIANNYRNERQAFYNAMAGVEAGKYLLRELSNWDSVVPAANSRPINSWDWTLTNPVANKPAWSGIPSDAYGNPARDFEGSNCDVQGGGVGYGVVLNVPSLSFPLQYQTVVGGYPVNGAFTLWARRPIQVATTGDTNYFSDYSADSDTIVLTSEGVAPFTGSTLGRARALVNVARVVIQVIISRTATQGPTPPFCGDQRMGQAGVGSEGAGFGACPLMNPTETNFLGSGINLEAGHGGAIANQ